MEIFNYYSTINKYHNVKAESEIVPKGIMFHGTGENNPNLKRYVGPDDELLGKNQYNDHWN